MKIEEQTKTRKFRMTVSYDELLTLFAGFGASSQNKREVMLEGYTARLSPSFDDIMYYSDFINAMAEFGVVRREED